MHRFLIALTLAAAATASAPAAPPRATAAAPLLMPAMPLHDPWIVADEATGTYHPFTRNETAMTGDRRVGIMVYTSRDLKHWTKPRMVFALPSGTWRTTAPGRPRSTAGAAAGISSPPSTTTMPSCPPVGVRRPVRRGTLLAVADALGGPFNLVRDGAPIADKSLMTLDGTLHVDAAGKPWYVYAREWVQIGNGLIEALPLTTDLAAAGPPKTLFHASAAPRAD